MKRLFILAACALLGAASAWAGSVGIDPGPFGNTLFVRGGFNGWGATDAMTYDASTESYTATLTIESGLWEFKIADEGWSNPDFGNIGDPNVVLGAPLAIGTASFGNLILDSGAGGTFEFVLSELSGDLQAATLTVTQVPLPAAFVLLASGLAGFGFLRKR